MYLLELYYANARLSQTGKFILPRRKGTIPKWTILSSHPKDREKLQLMALAMAGTPFTAYSISAKSSAQLTEPAIAAGVLSGPTS